MKNMKKILAKIENDEIVNSIKKYAQEKFSNAEIYLVGGVFRDYFLDKPNYDKDIVINKSQEQDGAENFARGLAKALHATFIVLDDENKIYRLVMKDKINFIDVAGMVGDSIEEDLMRRDLTINSIAVNIKTLDIIDVNDGIRDLRAKKIRHICEQNFIDDPLRLLRVYRFEAMLGFEIDEELTQIIKNHTAKIKNPAVERVNYELLKLFSGDYCSNALIEMDKIGLMKEILPICEELKTVPPNLHHHLDLFHHSIEVINQIQIIFENSCPEIREHLLKNDFGGNTRLAHLKFAGLLHDIGKPSTWTIEEDTGRHRFIKHDDVGAKMCMKLLKSEKFSKKQIDYIAKMVKYHIYPSHVVAAPEINEKIYMRLIRKMGNEVIDVIILAMADRLSARGVEITDEIVEKNINNLQALLDFYLNIKDNLQPLPKLISGNEIMKMLDIKPSPQLGKIIKALQEAQLAGDVSTKNDALLFCEKVAKSSSSQ